MGRPKRARMCPRCAGKDILLQDTLDDGTLVYVCADCDYEFEVAGSWARRRNDETDDEDEYDSQIAGEEWES